MQAISFQELIAITGAIPVAIGDLEHRVTRIEIDSRKIQAGDLFWALEGDRQDGHKFVKQALGSGAVAAVVEAGKSQKIEGPHLAVEDSIFALWQVAHWYRRQSEALVIGVTGSVGKTTTRRMIASVLGSRFTGIESPLNFNNKFGVPLSLLQIEPHHEFAVIELGASRVGEIDALSTVAEPEVGVITAIGPAHLDEFGTLEAIVKTKGELLESLPPSGFAVLNGDDRQIRLMAARATCPVLFVGEREQNDVRAVDVQHRNEMLLFAVDGTPFELTATGRHHLTSALIAIAIGKHLDMTGDEIAAGLRNFRAAPGRCETTQIGGWTVIDDTYNASPLSMSAACHILRDWESTGKRILVTGDMLALGEWSQDFHRLFGEEASRSKLNRLIAVGSQAAVVAGSARKHGMDAGCLGVAKDHDLALMLLDCWLEPGDVVLVKGSRGMKMEVIVHGLHRLASQRSQNTTDERKAA
ncbi:UDP-N-acetylmuramoyl-tripeptide--D-alanyl-D-alanine ligase [Planctomicrobium sp. SH661]|uniref:UDP-N-acetylmuramoyl-tripeptide--D-alanyl-D- alanine ligase n=1 Tax=Planctomicrobium sp. SH661 TaxID=3448124 RepID=UPI003F5BDC3D